MAVNRQCLFSPLLYPLVQRSLGFCPINSSLLLTCRHVGRSTAPFHSNVFTAETTLTRQRVNSWPVVAAITREGTTRSFASMMSGGTAAEEAKDRSKKTEANIQHKKKKKDEMNDDLNPSNEAESPTQSSKNKMEVSKAKLVEAGSHLTEAVKAVGSAAFAGASVAASKTVDVVSDVASQAGAAVAHKWKDVKAAGANKVESMKQTAAEKAEKVKQGAADTTETMKQSFDDMKYEGKKIFTEAGEDQYNDDNERKNQTKQQMERMDFERGIPKTDEDQTTQKLNDLDPLTTRRSASLSTEDRQDNVKPKAPSIAGYGESADITVHGPVHHRAVGDQKRSYAVRIFN